MFELTFTIIVLLVMTALLVMDVYKASVIMFGALLTFYFAGILNIEEALSGFSNQGMLTITTTFLIHYIRHIKTTNFIENIAYSFKFF